MPTLKSIIKKLSILIVILTVLSYWSQQYDAEFDEYLSEESSLENGPCNVSRVKVQGEICTYIIEGESDVSSSEDIVFAIEKAEQDESIKAILLTVDSYGGGVVTGEEIANALKRTQKPTVVVIRGAGASGAYWAATGADRVFASSSSDVGGIGVTMSYLDNSKKNEADGLTYNGLSAGKFKDTGNPDKTLTEEEKRLLQRDVDIVHEKFISAVAINRNLDIEKVRILADGSTMMGDTALANGLIDQIGGVFEAREYLKGIIGEDATVCQ